jgi:RimJ/RimL family protein N-acetyltransferase
VIVREARPSDAEACVELALAVGAEPEGWLISTTEWRTVADERRYIKALQRWPHAAVLVAEEDGAIVGRLSISRDTHPASAHVADLGVIVAAERRGRGVGTALLEAAIEWARSVGVGKIELHVFPWNEAAIALYEKLGFEREGYRKKHYLRGDGEFADAILMALEVRGGGR